VARQLSVYYSYLAVQEMLFFVEIESGQMSVQPVVENYHQPV